MTGGATASDPVREYILQLLGETNLRMTPTDLMGALAGQFPGLDRKILRTTVRKMVTLGLLIYSHHFSSTHIELGSSGIIPISARLSLGTTIDQGARNPSPKHLKVQSGSAFGRGDHPTTILSLYAIDWISTQRRSKDPTRNIKTLDIGTGTGVLAMAAELLGLGPVVAIDIDPLACHEAMSNVRINGLAGRVHIVSGSLELLGPAPFDTIMANLRPPTLVGLIPAMAMRTDANGYWVLSGFRPGEGEAVLEHLPVGFRKVWSRENRNWSAVAIQRVKGGF